MTDTFLGGNKVDTCRIEANILGVALDRVRIGNEFPGRAGGRGMFRSGQVKSVRLG